MYLLSFVKNHCKWIFRDRSLFRRSIGLAKYRMGYDFPRYFRKYDGILEFFISILM